MCRFGPGSFRLCVELAARPPQVFVPARLLLVDVDIFVTAFCGCELVLNLKVWMGARHLFG
jgi:hypothetical protein